MIQMLIIAACIIVHMGDGVRVIDADDRWPFAYIALLAIVACVVQVICWRARLRMDRVGWGYARHLADRAVFFSRIATVLLHACAVLGFGGLGWVRERIGDQILLDEAICLLPVIASFAAGWWSIYPLERRVREALLYRELHAASEVRPIIGRGAFVWARMREAFGITLIPIGLATASLETLDRFGAPALQRVLQGTPLEHSISSIHAVASTLVVLCVLAVAPALVRFAWDLVPLPEGQTRGAISSVMARRRIRVIGPMVWRTGGDSVNAAILGAIFPFRYMVFTDALLASVPLRQIQAVTAHEIAHVRLHHMPWMMVCVVSSVYALGWVAAIGAWAMGISTESETATLVVSVAMLLPVAWLFGIVSRRMEWQADAYAARVLTEIVPVEPANASELGGAVAPSAGAAPQDGTGAEPRPDPDDAPLAASGPTRITPEAAAAVVGALQTVADLNSMNPAARSFRHGSIRTRQNRILALVGQDVSRLPIDRTVRWIKWGAVAAIACAAVLHIVAELL